MRRVLWRCGESARRSTERLRQRSTFTAQLSSLASSSSAHTVDARPSTNGALLAHRSVRAYSAQQQERKEQQQPHTQPPPTGGFFKNLVDNLNSEMARNKELEENKRRLQEEISRMRDSEELKQARAKFDVVSQETLDSTQKLKKKAEELQEQISKAIADVRETEYGKRAFEVGEQVAKAGAEAAGAVKRQAEALGDAPGVKQVADTMKAVQSEINDVTLADAHVYRQPEVLKSRSDYAAMPTDGRRVAVNEEATGIELHKSSRMFESFRQWTEDNAAYNRFLDWKMRLDESDTVFARLTRVVTDGVQSALGAKSDLSEVLTEISRVDPSFDKDQFTRFCEREIIPNVLEGIRTASLDVLKDWLHERAYKQVEPALSERIKMKMLADDKILDVSRVELHMGKMMEYGPLLVITFQVYTAQCLRNADGKIIEGDPDNPVRVNHVWTLCRDMDELDPRAAWQVLEMHWLAQT